MEEAFENPGQIPNRNALAPGKPVAGSIISLLAACSLFRVNESGMMCPENLIFLQSREDRHGNRQPAISRQDSGHP
jgi:hypothetical protein